LARGLGAAGNGRTSLLAIALDGGHRFLGVPLDRGSYVPGVLFEASLVILGG
jgi:hypothetical protein